MPAEDITATATFASTGSTPPAPPTPPNGDDDTLPQTGDSATLLVVALIMLCLAAGVFLVERNLRHNRRKI
jgi:LPXTG-motif cell wall-anchored protein